MVEVHFDIETAHRYFAANCFNMTWELLNKPSRTAEENDLMLQRALASLWHWTQRVDCTPTNLSVGYWQVSRVFADLGQVDNARHYGNLCLTCSQDEGVEPFYVGYAYEALARTEMVAGNRASMTEYLNAASDQAQLVTDVEDRQTLLADLSTIQ